MTITTRNEQAIDLPEKPEEDYRTPYYSAKIAAKWTGYCFSVDTPSQLMDVEDLEAAIGRYTALVNYAEAVKENEGFTHAALKTENSAKIHARFIPTGKFGGPTFKVATSYSFDDTALFAYYFDKDACVEASEFFAKLAEELDRRGY